MFFSGDPSSKRKVDLGGRSSKETDRQKLLERTRLEREQRQRTRLNNQSAIKIQKCYKGRKAVDAERPLIRREFCATFGEHGEKSDRDVFKPPSKYLPQLFYFFRLDDAGDFARLIGACQFLLQCYRETGNVLDVFSNGEFSYDKGAIIYRVKHLVRLCLYAIHHNREVLKAELLMPVQQAAISSKGPATVLVEVILLLTRPELPWAETAIQYVEERQMFALFRGLLLMVEIGDNLDSRKLLSSLEMLILTLSKRTLGRVNTNISALRRSFACQILSIPLLWRRFPLSKQIAVSEGLWASAVEQLATSLPNLMNMLPASLAPQFPSSVCLLGNIVEIAGLAFSFSNCTSKIATEFSMVARYLIEELPSYYSNPTKNIDDEYEDDMEIDNSNTVIQVPEPALEEQIHHIADIKLLDHLVRCVSFLESPETTLYDSVGAVCSFLYATFSLLPAKGVVRTLAYSTQLIPKLWEYMKRCCMAHLWRPLALPGYTGAESQLTPEWLGGMLPLAVFCPVYSCLLMSVDSEEFYERQRPLSIIDVIQLVHLLKEALWQILCIMPSKSSNTISMQRKIFYPQNMKANLTNCCATLLAELHDRNSKRQFTSPQDFHVRECFDENFLTQAESENTKAYELLKQAPFLIPFTSRVRIYTAQLSNFKQANNHEAHLPRFRMTIRRDRIVEDAFAQLNSLPAEALRGTIRVIFVNELGVEEAGVDGGGMFKDFMENITKAAFDIQYGLFKETTDHLLYPNPASHMVHDDHLHYFEFLGKVLGKAMFEGILVDIPFAAFFLRKLRKKHNYLHDLPSLDPELYRSLMFLKHYDGDVSSLGLYFAVEINEYGEHLEVELLPGGKDMPVTNSNVIRYIHLVANHHLNIQIRKQSDHFLRGFQQLILPEWIDMFNEHELQILISGSQEGLDIGDLQANVTYAGGYHENHPVIQKFWEIIKNLDQDMQRNFLKFVTGCSRGPLLGFKYLEPQFCIQRTAPEDASEETLDRLPTSATCMNLLKLPPYRSKDIIKEKLLYAITAGAGFDLS